MSEMNPVCKTTNCQKKVKRAKRILAVTDEIQKPNPCKFLHLSPKNTTFENILLCYLNFPPAELLMLPRSFDKELMQA